MVTGTAAGADEGTTGNETVRVVITHETEPGERPSFEVVETDLEGFTTMALDPDVTSITIDTEAELFWSPSDPHYSSQWEHQVTGMESAWEHSRGSAAIVIAVLDSGVNPGPEFGDRLLEGKSFTTGDPHDDQLGHGTAVASVAAGGADNGIAGVGTCPSCMVLPVQVANPNGSVPWSAAAAGVIWAVDNGADIINMSFGAPAASVLMRSAVEYALAQGVVVFASAGNYGNSYRVFPADFDGVLGVAGHNADLDRYSWSSYGDWAEVAAPGCATAVTKGGVGVVCGTSFASPWTAGVAGLLMAADPAFEAGTVRDAILEATRPVDYVSVGRLDATRLDFTAPTQSGFDDVPIDAYYAEPVSWLVQQSITTGTSPTAFSPDEPVTRGQLATFLWRYAGSPDHEPSTASSSRFVDTDPAMYYADAVDWMVKTEITTGTGPDEFSPDQAVTRGQLAAFLWRYSGRPGTVSQAPFDDVDPGTYYAHAVDWLVGSSITTGTSPTTYDPDAAVTRGQIATFLWRMANATP